MNNNIKKQPIEKALREDIAIIENLLFTIRVFTIFDTQKEEDYKKNKFLLEQGIVKKKLQEMTKTELKITIEQLKELKEKHYLEAYKLSSIRLVNKEKYQARKATQSLLKELNLIVQK